MTAFPREPELVGSVYRTARFRWDCKCPGNGHDNCPHKECAQVIAIGDRYVEYLGEAGPFESGTRYCLPCGVATWAESRRDGR